MEKIEMLRKQREKANAEYLEGTLEEMQSDPHCPHCGRPHCHRHGKTKKGTPRYYCPDCRRAFVYNVQTVFCKSHKNMDQWHRYVECYLRGESLDVCARECEIHRNTAFRWRHKLNEALNKLMNQDLLEGTVYLDETFVPRLESRNEERQGSKKKRGISDQKINICCAIDHTGKTVLQASAYGRIKSENLIHVFQGKIKEGSDLVSDSQRSYHRMIKELKVNWHKIPSGRKKVENYTLEKVNHLHSRLKQYLQRFHGVSYAFLQGYILMFKMNEFYKKTKIMDLSERLMVKLITLKMTLTCQQIDRKQVSWLIL